MAGAEPEQGRTLGPKRQALYGRLTGLREDAVRTRKKDKRPWGQAELQRAVRLTGLDGAAGFNGQRISTWLPPADRAEACQVPQEGEVLLAVVAVWSAWAGKGGLLPDGRVDARWLKRERAEWDRLLEQARTERDAAQKTRSGEAAALEHRRTAREEEAVEVYRSRVRAAYRRLNLDVLGPAGSAGEQAVIELRQVFVPQLSRPYTAQVPGEWRRLLTTDGPWTEGELPPGVEAQEAARRRNEYHAQAARPVLEVLAGEEGWRLVVLGDPGAGKSTLTQYVALALAGGLSEAPAELARLAGLVPVVVELRTYAQERWRERTFGDYVAHAHDLHKAGLPRPVLDDLVARGRAVMLFDGLDEIFDPAVRADIAQRITAFAAAHPGVRTVVTSREYGYRPGDFAPHGFTQVMLQDLERRQVEQFVPRWYAAAHPADHVLADRLTRRLLGAVRQVRAVAELAGNPLLLTVLASMGLGRTIPRERREVYAHAVQILIDRWDRDGKFLTAPFPAAAEAVTVLEWLSTTQRLRLLEHIARHMQEGAADPAGTFIRYRELTALVSAFLTDHGHHRHAADIATERLVEQLHTRNFLLAHYGDGVYGFVHRTFLEYLAACDILRRRTEEELSRDELLDLLTEHAADPAWHEVILLTAGGLKKRDAAALIARLLDRHRATDHRWQAPMLLLAVRTLAELDDFRSAPATTDPRLSVAAQSDAVVDALISATHRSTIADIDDALAALGTFDHLWPGRQRYLRHYYATMAFAAAMEPFRGQQSRVAAALCLDPAEAVRLAHLDWSADARRAALRVLGERWPESDGVFQSLLGAATDTDPGVCRVALRVLGERWSEHDEVLQTALATATDSGTDPGVCRVALRVLGERWPEREEVFRTVLATATATATDSGTDSAVRWVALEVLGERWPEHDDARRAVLTAMADTDPGVRWVALEVSGERWPERDDARQGVLTAVTVDTEPIVCRAALGVLGERWPERDDARQGVLAAITDTEPIVRRAALEVSGERWPEREDVFQAALAAAVDTEPDVRWAALEVLGEWWPEHDDAHRAVLAAATDTTTDTDVRRAALRVLVARSGDAAYPVVCQHAHPFQPAELRIGVAKALALLWPHQAESARVLTAMAEHDEEEVRTTANEALALIERWSPSTQAG